MHMRARACEAAIGQMVRAAAVMVGILVLAGPSRAQDYTPSQAHFRAFAHELLAGIGASDLADIPAIGGYGKPRIAVLPFTADDEAVPKSVSGEFNARLLAALTRQGNRNFRFVARDSLKAIIGEIDSIAELEPGADERVADLLRNARVDILVLGRLRKTDDGVVLSYKAVSTEDGTLFAATMPRRLPRAQAAMVARARDPVPLPSPDFVAPSTGLQGRPRVAEAQRLLVALGYHPGPADGVMRPRTRAALSAFQRTASLPVNGRMTRRVVQRLRTRHASR